MPNGWVRLKPHRVRPYRWNDLPVVCTFIFVIAFAIVLGFLIHQLQTNDENQHSSSRDSCFPGYAFDLQHECQDIDQCSLTQSNPCAILNGTNTTCCNINGGFLCLNETEIPCASINQSQFPFIPGPLSKYPEGPVNEASMVLPSPFPPLRAFEVVSTQTLGPQMGALCVPINECRLHMDNCDFHATCTDQLIGFSCQCDPGWEDDKHGNFPSGVVCHDIDECSPSSPDPCAGLNAICVNTPGSFECVSPTPEGWEWAWDVEQNRYRFLDVNECLQPNFCSTYAHCLNNEGSYDCVCKSGFTGDGFDCEGTSQCWVDDNYHESVCPEHSHCEEVDHALVCTCDDGYNDVRPQVDSTQIECVDIDECATFTDNCGMFGVCLNLEGGFTCVCEDGYTLDPETLNCVDIDECSSQELSLCHAEHGLCTNINGSFHCRCAEGYQGDGVDVCDDVNECSMFEWFGHDHIHSADCSEYATCTNTDGAYNCSCISGFVGDGWVCDDVDECTLIDSNISCPEYSTCVNYEGTYLCQCNMGFFHSITPIPENIPPNLIECIDVNECGHTDTCHSQGGRCINTPGSYECECQDGWTGDGFICEDIDECAPDMSGNFTHGCAEHAKCVNWPGGFMCYCSNGFLLGLGTEESPCLDFDECNLHASILAYATVYGGVIPGYPGHPSFGYMPPQQIARECQSSPLGTCVNTPGDYICGCVDGYLWNNDTWLCENINECLNASLHDCDESRSTCEDTEGSFTCRCFAGYVHPDEHEKKLCQDVDECALTFPHPQAAACDAHASCANYNGSYECMCDMMWFGDGYNCEQEPRCTQGDDSTCPPHSQCKSYSGIDICCCKEGFRRNDTSIYVTNPAMFESFTIDDLCLDLDECLEIEVCSDFAFCTNTPGSFECFCEDGFEGDGLHCADIDECSHGSLNLCDQWQPESTCTNTFGSYTCACNLGFEGSGWNNGSCIDIDECHLHLDNCDTHRGVCHNTPGSFECSCAEGWEDDPIVLNSTGPGIVCTDIDECSHPQLNNCTPTLATCFNLQSTFECRCNSGYTGTGEGSMGCIDINECTTPLPGGFFAPGCCDTQHGICNNTEGGHTCSCAEGFFGNGYTCVDQDECSLENQESCPQRASCVNLEGTYLCLCDSGFLRYVDPNIMDPQPSDVQCLDIDECVEFSVCDNHANCTNLPGSFSCACLPGWQDVGPSNGLVCEDVNECTMGTHDCDLNPTFPLHPAICSETPGSWSCACPPGFEGTGVGNGSCVDIDECVLRIDNCDSHATCQNKPGSFSCQCDIGWVDNQTNLLQFGAGVDCLDKNECLSSVLNDCHPTHATCSNTMGSYECRCHSGYKGTGHNQDGMNGCIDIDECLLSYPDPNAHHCHADAVCSNLGGNYSCNCKPGFAGDGWSCGNINECAGTNACLSPVATCHDFEGTFMCTCPVSGYRRVMINASHSDCVDIDECVEFGACDNHATCTNTNGSFTCACQTGFIGDGISCLDIDECKHVSLHTTCSLDNTICVNTVGSYACRCKDGFNGTARLGEGGEYEGCTDLDECALGWDYCAMQATCTNTDGSYSCACNMGYEGDGFNCGNMNECSQMGMMCPMNSECIDTDGTFLCLCNEGYFRNSSLAMNGHTFGCQDRDECQVYAACDTFATCNNTPSHFTCACNAGFEGDGFVCRDLNECLGEGGGHACHANAECTNALSNYSCACKEGFEGDGILSCVDIDECARYQDNCASEAWCINTPGSFTCECKTGFTDNLTISTQYGPGISCLDIDECTDPVITHGCDEEHATCHNTRGSYSCVCDVGFHGPGLQSAGGCVDIDECAFAAPHAWAAHCDSHATCLNTVGSYNCTCDSGFSGNGWTCGNVNECNASVPVCTAPEATCVDFEGTWLCDCPAGFLHHIPEAELDVECEDIDECTVFASACDRRANCTNVPGSFTCACQAGFEGDGHSCSDINECVDPELFSCPAHSRCVNLEGGYTCVCDQGFSGNATLCSDVDECTLPVNHSLAAWCHPSRATCTNTNGSFTCECNPGFEGDGVHCVDVDECSLVEEGNECPMHSECQNVLGTFICLCEAPGYLPIVNVTTQQLKECQDIDECELYGACGNRAVCTNVPGSFTCSCGSGFTGNGIEDCDDINECSNVAWNDCHDTKALCINQVGGYDCRCKDGYVGDGINCEDVSECSSWRLNNCSDNAVCTDLTTEMGSFMCSCPEPLIGMGVGPNGCVEPDMCNVHTQMGCGMHATCQMFNGMALCFCDQGWTGDGQNCTDVNECNITFGPTPCAAHSTCQNTMGNYTCDCDVGYSGDGRVEDCVDWNECIGQGGGHDCPLDEIAECVNTPGSFQCVCASGYHGDGYTCESIDECASPFANDCHSLATCQDLGPTADPLWNCSCTDGWSGDGHGNEGCLNVNECDPMGVNPCGTHAVCLDSTGSFLCACEAGYQNVNGPQSSVTDCQNINECALLIDHCAGSREANCTDTDGSFTCVCKEGFSGDGVTCVDINECADDDSICGEGTECVNTYGSFECPCVPLGQAIWDEGSTSCIDVDECADDELNDCHAFATCTNTAPGEGNYNGRGFNCTCQEGWNTTAFHGHTRQGCVDQDACMNSASCSVHASCVDVLGSYYCVCDEGYEANGTQVCVNIDECALGSDNCDSDATCTDTEGSFTCACNVGFLGDGIISCEDIDECADSELNDCDVHAICTNTVGNWTCACNQTAGWTGAGTNGTCVDFDECVAGHPWHTCHPNATCANLDVATSPHLRFNCSCVEDYEGTGFGYNGCIAPNILTCPNPDPCPLWSTCVDIGAGIGFQCQCNPGWVGNGVNCTDVDECALGEDLCVLHATCTNTAGSYTCACNTDYVGDGLDFCALDCGPHSNTLPDGSCECHVGYELEDGSNISCVDIDECVAGTHSCTVLPPELPAQCTNTDGSFVCTCPEGTMGDGHTCVDVNECTLGTYECPTNSVCSNTYGAYVCVCGGTVHGVSGPVIPSVAVAPGVGVDRYLWRFGIGVDVDNDYCDDLNECVSGVHLCDADMGICSNMVGDYSCACPPTYSTQNQGQTCVPESVSYQVSANLNDMYEIVDIDDCDQPDDYPTFNDNDDVEDWCNNAYHRFGKAYDNRNLWLGHTWTGGKYRQIITGLRFTNIMKPSCCNASSTSSLGFKPQSNSRDGDGDAATLEITAQVTFDIFKGEIPGYPAIFDISNSPYRYDLDRRWRSDLLPAEEWKVNPTGWTNPSQVYTTQNDVASGESPPNVGHLINECFALGACVNGGDIVFLIRGSITPSNSRRLAKSHNNGGDVELTIDWET